MGLDGFKMESGQLMFEKGQRLQTVVLGVGNNNTLSENQSIREND
jgi:hypothetical protein